MSTPSTFLLLLFLVSPAAAQDECATATPINLGQVLSFDTGGATASPEGWSMACGSGPRPDTWFEFVAPVSGTFRAQTCGGSDSALQVFRGGCGVLAHIECDSGRCRFDDPFSRGAKVYFQADAGEVVHMRVGSSFGGTSTASGSLSVSTFAAVPHDDCATPLTIAAGDTVPIDLFEATAGGDPVPCGAAFSSDLWFEFIPQSTGNYSASTCGISSATFDTSSIAVYQGACSSQILLGCSSGNCNGSARHDFAAAAGQRYLLRVMGHFHRTQGDFSLVRIGGGPGDDCDTATVQQSDAFEPFDLAGATLSTPAWACGAALTRDTWRTVVVPATGPYVAYCYTSFPHPAELALAVYSGDCTALVPLGCESVADPATNFPTVRLQLNAGSVLKLRVGASADGNARGDVRLQRGAPNDECQDALTLGLEVPTPFEARNPTSSSQGWTCPPPAFEDFWFRFQAPATGFVRVEICDELDAFPRFEVYEGSCANLQQVACARPGVECVGRSAVVPTLVGRDYFVRVPAIAPVSQGTILVTERLLASNDTCAGATDLQIGQPVSFDLALASGAHGPFQPSQCAQGIGLPDLFYHFVPATSGRYALRACTGTSTPAVTVRHGTCATNVPIACAAEFCAIFPGTPGIAFEGHLDAGQTYLFQLLDRDGTRPSGTLELTTGAPPTNDACSNAIPIGVGTHQIDLSFATASAPQVGACAGVSFADAATDVWYRFRSPMGGPTALLLCDAPFGTTLRVYDGGGCSSAPLITCAWSGGGPACGVAERTGPGVLLHAVANQDYLLQIHSPGGVGFVGTLRVDDSFTTGSFGFAYCAAASNSTGQPAQLTAIGSASVLVNDLTLRASSLPPGAVGYFLTSRNQDLVIQPGASAGDLCLGAPIGGFRGQGQVAVADPLGRAELRVPIHRLPQPWGSVPGLAGEIWNWQLWYRDSVGGAPGSNFSPALTFMFE